MSCFVPTYTLFAFEKYQYILYSIYYRDEIYIILIHYTFNYYDITVSINFDLDLFTFSKKKKKSSDY